MMLRYAIFISTILLSSCEINSTIEFAVENKSAAKVDTLKIFLPMKEYKLTSLTAGTVSKIYVPLDSLETNPHDFTVQATGIVNHDRRINGFYYTDLSGTPEKKYTITIYDSIAVINPK